jgi:hypothetical protein
MPTRPARRAPPDAAREPHPVHLEGAPAQTPPPPSDELTARHRPGLPAPHVGRPVRGCTCWLCQEHRRWDRQAARDHARGQLYEYHGGRGSVQCGATATQALRDALGAS